MKKNLFLISIIIIVIYGFSAVCADDMNETADNLEVSDDFNDKLSSVDNYKNVNDSVKLNESSKQSSGLILNRMIHGKIVLAVPIRITLIIR